MIDKKWFDMEYSTQVKQEVDFLKKCGIRYTYVKRVNTIPVYKYTKNVELFDALKMYYTIKTGGNI